MSGPVPNTLPKDLVHRLREWVYSQLILILGRWAVGQSLQQHTLPLNFPRQIYTSIQVRGSVSSFLTPQVFRLSRETYLSFMTFKNTKTTFVSCPTIFDFPLHPQPRNEYSSLREREIHERLWFWSDCPEPVPSGTFVFTVFCYLHPGNPDWVTEEHKDVVLNVNLKTTYTNTKGQGIHGLP